VVSWAKGAGLTVTHLYPNRLVVDLAGPVGAIEKALGVQINNYRLGTKTIPRARPGRGTTGPVPRNALAEQRRAGRWPTPGTPPPSSPR
jgi:subtilase family serine protease